MKSRLYLILVIAAGLALAVYLDSFPSGSGFGKQCSFGFLPKHWARKSVVPVPPRQLVPGERAVFSLRWLGIEVGRSEALLKEIVQVQGRSAYHIVVKNRSNPFLDLIFKVRDEYHSYLDIADLKSLRFEKIVQEGNYRADEEIDFDHAKGEGRYHSRLNEGRKTFPIDPGTVDGIGVFYRYRLAPLERDKEAKIPLTWDEEKYDLRVLIVSEEELRGTILGPRKAYKLKPYILNTKDPNIKSSRVTIWLSSDRERIPLRMKTKVPIAGSVDAVLVEYQSSEK